MTKPTATFITNYQNQKLSAVKNRICLIAAVQLRLKKKNVLEQQLKHKKEHRDAYRNKSND